MRRAIGNARSSPTDRLLIARSSSAHRLLIAHSSSDHRLLVVCSSPTHHLLVARSLSAHRPVYSPPTHRPVHATNYKLLIGFPPDILTTESAEHRIGARRALAGPFAAFQKVLSCLQSHHNLIYVASWPIIPTT